MAFTVEADTGEDEVKRQVQKFGVGEEARMDVRRQYFEKLASLHSGKQINVTIEGRQAFADITDQEDLQINIPEKIPEQYHTDYSEDVWEMLFQKVELYHELGHVLYTDWPSFEKNLDRYVDVRDYPIFKEWWNILEDAVIERLLQNRFSIENDLWIKNENLLRSNRPSSVIGVKQAISIRFMEEKHELGWIDQLLDPDEERLRFDDGSREIYLDIQDIIEQHVPGIIGEGDPVERNERILELYQRVIDRVEDDMENPEMEKKQTNLSYSLSDDADDGGDEGEGMEVEVPVRGDEKPDEDESGEPQNSTPPESEPDGDEMEEIEEDYQEEMKQEQQVDAEEEEEQRIASVVEWSEAVESAGDRDMSLVVDPDVIGTDHDAIPGQFAESRAKSQRLAMYLNQKLRRQRRSSKRKGLRSGRVNSRSIHKTQQGDANIFHREAEPDEKDYSCAIVLDRSGSMDEDDYNIFGEPKPETPDMMPDAERAAGSLALALEEVGVETTQVSMFDNQIMLEKDFTESVEQCKKEMFHGQSNGKTPLTEALTIARERLEGSYGHPFVVVITDGEPDYINDYVDELEKCNCPVLGVYINEEEDGYEKQGIGSHSRFFHKLETREYTEAYDGVRQLVKSIMF